METYNRPKWAAWFPEDSGKSGGVTAVISGCLGLITVWLGVNVFKEYGLVLFTGVPIMLGILAPAFHGMGARRSFGNMLGISILAQIFLFAGMLVFGIEGLVCLFMAAPLWLTFAVVGTCIAYPIHAAMWRNHVNVRGFPVVGLLLMAALPMFMGAEHVARVEPPLQTMTTSIDIDAPAATVWKNVVSFEDMPTPDQWIFSLGVAHPIRAEIEGTGVGATRYCVFSTGKAVEPVRTWEENRLLEVDVTVTPPSMEELSFYTNLHPAHLEGYLTSARARFELVPLANGKTRLIGTSWYRNRMSPAFYWNLWSDQAIRAVQVSVLTHIKGLSEFRVLQTQGDFHEHP
jgi:hypothetical protein